MFKFNDVKLNKIIQLEKLIDGFLLELSIT